MPVFALCWCVNPLIAHMIEPLRLAKRLAEMLPCSRSQAEQYIEGGWVSVNGRVEESPQHRVTNERIELHPDATLLASVPMTVLLHKPAGYDWGDGRKPAGELLQEANRSRADRSGARLLKRHLKEQVCVTPLEAGASGLLVFTQDYPIRRKLWEDAALVENEVIVDVTGEVTPETLHMLNRPLIRNSRPVLVAKVALSKQTDAVTGLRFAIKGGSPGGVAMVCEHAGLTVVAMKRIRVGRIPMADLAPGQWRFLMQHERF
jgi:23S rRNA pseudouridine2604 synthase